MGGGSGCAIQADRRLAIDEQLRTIELEEQPATAEGDEFESSLVAIGTLQDDSASLECSFELDEEGEFEENELLPELLLL